MQREGWEFSRKKFEIDKDGAGLAIYCAKGPVHTYSLIAFAHDLPADKRSDRVIAEAWDATFALFDGVPSNDEVQQLARNIPYQEAGRVGVKVLSVSRANRSVRLWEHVVAALASGQQPDKEKIAAVGYLMRTTAVYGSGKLGAADREVIADRPEMAAPFQAEMLSVFLTRAFVRDLVQHMADTRGEANSVQLAPDISRSMGIGNSTGLGIAPFILNHPVLFNNWIAAREEAIARVRRQATASSTELACFHEMLERSIISVKIWKSEHPVQRDKLQDLRRDLSLLSSHAQTADLTSNFPWNRLYNWAESVLSVEGQECLASLLLEPYGELVDKLADSLSADAAATFHIDASGSVSSLVEKLERLYHWALSIDWDAKENCARLWYVSAEKLEPRLAQRFVEPVEAYERPLAPARDAALLYACLKGQPANTGIAEFLLHHPQHRHTVRRLQILDHAPYAEVRDNTISANMLPIDFLRCKLGFFGAIHFDPRSDRWVRISMYGNAPFPEELAEGDADCWPYPALEEVVS
jgi:hypothetical protein